MIPLVLLVVVVVVPILAFKGIGSHRRIYGALCLLTSIIFVFAFIYPGAKTTTLAAVNSVVASGAIAGFIGSLLGVGFFRKPHRHFR